MKFKAILLATGLLLSGAVQAGPYSDALSACLAGKSTIDDHMVFVQWTFAAMSKHPAISSIVTIPDVQMDGINARAGALFTRLLTVTCRSEAKAAIKNEGIYSLNQAFQALAQEAGREIFTDPNVVKDMADLAKYADSKKFAELREP